MAEVKAILFDADGVTIIPGNPFSVQYAAEQGFDPKSLDTFFDGEFKEAMVGHADLKELLEKNRELWHFDGDVDELVDKWFQSENHPNAKLVELIGKLKEAGIKCYLATNQERYRMEFIRQTMFPGVFDEVFSSTEIGSIKPSTEFFHAVLEKLASFGIQPDEILYFDDSERNVEAASKLGIKSCLYESPEQVQKLALL